MSKTEQTRVEHIAKTSETIKDEFAQAKPVRKLIPLIVDVDEEKQLADLLTIVRFKKN